MMKKPSINSIFFNSMNIVYLNYPVRWYSNQENAFSSYSPMYCSSAPVAGGGVADPLTSAK